MKYVRLLLALTILLALSGCDTGSVKVRQTAMNEYNDIIKEFNDLSRSITSFAKHLHSLLGDDPRLDVADEAFWTKYEELEEKVNSDIEVIEEYEIKNVENRAIEDELDALIEQTREYLMLNSLIKENPKKAKEMHKEQYDALLKLSSDITREFDVIYNRLSE